MTSTNKQQSLLAVLAVVLAPAVRAHAAFAPAPSVHQLGAAAALLEGTPLAEVPALPEGRAVGEADSPAAIVGGMRISRNGHRETTGGTLGLVVHHPRLGDVGLAAVATVLPPYSDGYCCRDPRPDDLVYAEEGNAGPMGQALPRLSQGDQAQITLVLPIGGNSRRWGRGEIAGFGGARVTRHYDGMAPLTGAAVSKFGAGSGLTSGVVTAQGVVHAFRTLGSITGLIEIRGTHGEFSRRGDAGAVVVREVSPGRLEALGVLIGIDASGTRAYAVPMNHIWADFGITP